MPLTECAWKFRYSGDPEERTVEEVGGALGITSQELRPPAGIVLHGREFGREKAKSPRKWGLFRWGLREAWGLHIIRG
jgi:hypothetical protein